MSLPIDAAPPSQLPPAASAPWPIQPPPHGAAYAIPVRPREGQRGQASWAGAFVAATAAAAVGLAVAIPLLVARRAKSSPNRTRGRAKA